MTQQQRVFISGLGLVSPLGLGVKTSWDKLCEGVSAARPIKSFDATDWPVEYACEVSNFIPVGITPEDLPYLNLPGQYAAVACSQAFNQAGLARAANPRRSGVIFGTGIGAIRPAEIVEAFKNYDLKPNLPRVLSYLEKEKTALGHVQIKNHPATLTAYLGQTYGLGGLSQSISTACASGAQSIGYGYRSIASGQSELMLVGGADSLAGELLFAGFCLLGVMSAGCEQPEKAARPFDKSRAGFVAGEGAAALVLESENSLLKRGGEPICEVCGYGESENAYRITDLPEDGGGAIFAMEQAAAGYKDEIDCINAHGTATRQNDKIECRAIEKVFYNYGLKPVVTANKSQIGHFVAAAGAVEAVFSALSVAHGVIPPLINFVESDCSEKIRFASRKAVKQRVRAVLFNSFGFGGTNASLLLKEVP